KNRNVVIVGLPGAFTPTSTKQIPDYVEKQDALRAKGVSVWTSPAVNDGAVMMNWAKSQRTALTMLTFLGDPLSQFTKATDLELTHEGPVGVLGPGRCKRFAMHVVDGVIEAVNVSEGEDDPAGDSDPSASLADGIMATMK
ncbi:hypothetical protein ACHAWF_012978, partial [Thalassiosira exigua]